MKKAVSIILFVLVGLSMMTVRSSATPAQENQALHGFIDGVVNLVLEYDADKEFAVSEPEDTEAAQTFSANKAQKHSAASSSAQNAEEPTSQANSKYTLQDFQTARLIVRANGNFDDFGAIENVSGFEDFHILQYESPEAAMEAYENLQTQKTAYSAAPDEVVAPLQGEQAALSEENTEEYLCEWSHDRTQSDRLLDYIESSGVQLQKTVVAVVDDGVHYDHPFLEGRIERTNFNSSSSGNINDEYGSPVDSHGTGVCSIIADNTPDNVLIRCYKVLDDGGYAPISQMCVGYIQAIEDGADVINISLGYWDTTGLTEACVKAAYEKNIPIFAAMGNSGEFDQNSVPGNIPECIAVSATDSNNTTVLWGTLSDASDISAPGQEIDVAMLENEYAVWDGTSFASPCAAALGAILKAQNPNITVDEMEEKIKTSSFDVKHYNFPEFNENDYTDNYHTILDGVGMIQYADAFGLPELAAPVFNLEDTIYLGAQTCSLACADDSAVILYTTDGTYPDLSNALVYTQPFEVAERTRIRAVAYYPDGGYYSRETEITPRILYQDSEDMYTITADGVITAYSGKVSDLYIPQTIHGITVTGIERGAFDKAAITSLVLPETVTEIPDYAFAEHKSLEFIRGDGVTSIGTQVFYESVLKYAEFPNVTEIGLVSFKMTYSFVAGYFPKLEVVGARAFQYSAIISFDGPEVRAINRGSFASCSRLESVNIPKCTETVWGIGSNGEFEDASMLAVLQMSSTQNLLAGALQGTRIKTADFPFLKTMKNNALYDCMSLKVIHMPLLESVPKGAFDGINITISSPKGRVYYLDSVTEIAEDAFGFYPTARIEFSHLVTAQSLPASNDENGLFPQQCTIAMPSTFKECTEDTVGRNYKVYGTKGTYAEEWANANGHKFIEISQETALLQDVPMEYTDETQVLCPDVIGFNRTYQWYGSLTADNAAGEPIEGATEKEFNPAEYPAYPYYYCVVTSTDVGFDPIEIRTGVTANKVAAADYSAYNTAVEKANALEREYYKDLTDLDAALAVDVSGLTVSEQAIVDAQTKAIEDALAALALKDADYTAYNAAVEKANALDRSLYADTTELDRLLGEDISGLTILEQDIVDTQTQAIENALNSLAFKPADYTKYNKAVEQAKALNRDLYEDLTALDEALAVDVSGKNITEQAEVDAQTQAILTAIENLVFKPADYTEYNKAVEQAKALNRDLYEDLTALDEALAADVSGKNITEQEEVDAQTQAILTAIENLVEKPVTEPETPEEPSQPVSEAPSETETTTQSDAKPSTDVKSPQTGANTSSVFGLSFICICSAVVLVFTSRKRKQ